MNNLIENQSSTIREAVAVFDRVEDLRETIVDLQQNGFMRQELGFIADDKNIRDTLGISYASIDDIKYNPDVPRADVMPDEPIGEAEAALIGVPFYAAAVLASAFAIVNGATLLATLMLAVAFGLVAALIGGYFSRKIAAHHEDYLANQIKRGGLLLWVHLRSPAREEIVRHILSRHAARNVQMHDMPLHS